MNDATSTVNTRIEELDFLISIMSELSMKYKNHNTKLLAELISTLEYRKDREEDNVRSRCKMNYR